MEPPDHVKRHKQSRYLAGYIDVYFRKGQVIMAKVLNGRKWVVQLELQLVKRKKIDR